MPNSVRISATIITYNEEAKISDCLKSLMEVADEIVVVDSLSTDATEEICKSYNVRFIKHPFEGYVAQKNYAMQMAKYDYVLSLDADERLSRELRRSIVEVKNDWRHDGYSFNRFNNYCGKWLRHGGAYPDNKIRLWDRRKTSWGGTDPHDSIIMSKSDVKKLRGDLLHYIYLNVDEHLKQISHFSEVAAKAKYRKGERANFLVNILISPFFRFINNYFFRMGFLDGYYGFVFSLLSSYLTLLKYIRLYEYGKYGIPSRSRLLIPVDNVVPMAEETHVVSEEETHAH